MHVLLCFGSLVIIGVVLFRLCLDTLWHLFVVTAGWKTILRRRDGLAKLLILEIYSLKTSGETRTRASSVTNPCSIVTIQIKMVDLGRLRNGSL